MLSKKTFTKYGLTQEGGPSFPQRSFFRGNEIFTSSYFLGGRGRLHTGGGTSPRPTTLYHDLDVARMFCVTGKNICTTDFPLRQIDGGGGFHIHRIKWSRVVARAAFQRRLLARSPASEQRESVTSKPAWPAQISGGTPWRAHCSHGLKPGRGRAGTNLSRGVCD